MVDKQLFQQSQQFKEFSSAVALGMVPGVEPDVKFGYASSISALGEVWPLATPYLYPVSAGQAVEAVSNNADDVYDLTIIGIDTITKKNRTETITLNGLTPVATSGTWLAINRAFNNNGTAFVGQINIQGTGTPNSNIFAVVSPDDQQTTQTPYMVPDGKVAIINNYSTAINKSGGADVSSIMKLMITKDGKVPRTQIRYGIQKVGVSNLSSDLIVPIPVPPLAKIQVSAEPSANADISAEYSMILVDVGVIEPAVLTAIIEG